MSLVGVSGPLQIVLGADAGLGDEDQAVAHGGCREVLPEATNIFVELESIRG